jgi:hypothetical protein
MSCIRATFLRSPHRQDRPCAASTFGLTGSLRAGVDSPGKGREPDEIREQGRHEPALPRA